MDYGYQLLRHVVQQVFGNIGAAARITIVPILLAYVLCGLILYAVAGAQMLELFNQPQPAFGEQQPNPFGSDEDALMFMGRFFLGFLLCIPVFLIFYSWGAVGWHRYVLLEELPGGFSARWNWPTIRSYIWAVVRLFFVMFLIGIGASIAVGIILAALPSPSVAVFLTVALTIGFTWATTRFGLVLPSASLGEYMSLGQSWNITGPVASAILLPIIVIPLVFFIINTLLGFVPIVGAIVSILVVWLQLLMNLALMTTLYGNLVEGRQLN